ncbi:unnamed protein product [Linum trigynum]|uniref:Zinc knuckle CX2CX4HX4C domain-containing protein n=1 Tax=Linum trigynum TaxID=586398 RepID=A0AAV2E788_9ROSI
MLVLARWANPSPEVAEQLRWAPMAVSFGRFRLIASLRKWPGGWVLPLGVLNEPPTLHLYDVSGGLYVRAAPMLDLTAPLPDEITAGHIDSTRGNFVATVKLERVPHFCFLCGVIGNIGEGCPGKDALAGAPPKYGVFSVATQWGPPVTEDTLSKRHRWFTWIRAAKNRPTSSRNEGRFWEPAPR